GTPVEFTAQSPQKDLSFSWLFEDGEIRSGKDIEYVFTETGHHTVILEAEDEETGAKTRYDKTLHIIDTNPPQFDVEPEVKKFDKNNSVKIEWDEATGMSEPFRYRIHHVTGEEIKWDHSFWKKSTHNNFIFLEDLDPAVHHNIKVSVRNDVGLLNTSAEPISFTVEDDLPPKFDGLDGTHVIDHSERIVQLGWDEADDPSEPITYKIYHSRDENMSFEHPIRTTTKTEKQVLLSDIGEHYFAVRCEDDEGNEDGNEEIKMVEVKDTTSPKIQISSHIDGQSVESSVTLEWNAYDNDSGISSYWVKRDDRNWNQVQEQIYKFKDLPEGEMTLTVKAVDNYNNSASDSVDLSVVNEIEPEIVFSDQSPIVGRTEVGTDIELSVVVEHEDDVDLNVSFYDAQRNTLIGTDEGLSSGETASVEWKDLEHNTTYEWYVIANDGEFSNSSTIWDFTTSSLAEEGHILEINIEGDGSVDVEPDLPSYEPGTEVTLTAEPDENSSFLGWTGDYESEKEKINVTMNSDKNLTVYFEINEYDLEINVDGEGATELGEGSYTYEHGEVVKVQAIPEEGWEFSHWKGDVPQGEEEQNMINITIDEDKEITAYFEEKPEEKGEDEESGILSYISLVQIILGVVLIALIALAFVVYRKSDVEIDQK
ncbi:MAG: InlB B-repeat-containing protein, partial [Candidatus Natronoplasma sp.]